ncbi:MAG: AAA family ATPase, partial [Bacteroidales bacterium]
KPWRWISKEIMYESARELNLEPKSIKYVFDYEQKSIIDDILASHSQKYYKSDRKIRGTVANVIRTFGEEGHVIIVGRGGVAITKDIPKSLHVHLEAPLEWRAIRASQKHGVSIEEAKRDAIAIDKKRKEFREYFEGKNTDYTRFDLTLNCMTLSVDELASIIADTAGIRGIV